MEYSVRVCVCVCFVCCCLSGYPNILVYQFRYGAVTVDIESIHMYSLDIG
jgi:hypothetical protein